MTFKTDWVDGDTVHAADLNAFGVALEELQSRMLPLEGFSRGGIVVASYDSSPSGKAGADYVCDGHDDHEEINEAIASLPSIGGRVSLLEGFFQCPEEIEIDTDSVCLEGQGGYSTVIGVPLGVAINRKGAIICGVTRKVQHCQFRDFSINANDFSNDHPEINPGTGHGIVITGGKFRIDRVNVQWNDGHPFFYSQSLLEPELTTTVAVSSDGHEFGHADYDTGDTFDVVSTAGFADAGIIYVRKPDDTYAYVQYDGKTSTSFTGCRPGWRGNDYLTDDLPEDYWDDWFTLSTGDVVFQGEMCYDGITYATFANDFSGYGYYIDACFSSCEWILARCQGDTGGGSDGSEGNVPTPDTMGDHHGFYVQGSVLKFLMCHPYFMHGSGMYIGGRHWYMASCITVDGGEYETCATDGISVRNNQGHVSLNNLNFYGNGLNWTGSDIRCAHGSQDVFMNNCRFYEGSLPGTNLLGKNIWLDGLYHGEISNCSFLMEGLGIDAIYASGDVPEQQWGRTARVKIHHNLFRAFNSGGHAVLFDGAVFDCEVSDNISDGRMTERVNSFYGYTPDRNLFRNNTLIQETGQNPTYTLVGPHSRIENGFPYRGVWDNATTYFVGDLVQADGKLYQLFDDHGSSTVNVFPPSNLTWWQVYLPGGGDAIPLDVATAAVTHSAASKATPVDADEFAGTDSTDSWTRKRFPWSGIKAALLSYITSAVTTFAGTAAGITGKTNPGGSLVGTTDTQTLTNKTYLSQTASTTTSAGTKTLLVNDAPVQIFTGSTTHTVKLPTTGVVLSQQWTFINLSTGAIAVQSSAGNQILVMGANQVSTFTAMRDDPTTAAASHWYPLSAYPYTGFNTLVQRDSQGVAHALNWAVSTASTVTAGTTLTLAYGSAQTQIFTGSSNHTVKLPTGGVLPGMRWVIINNSTGTITVQSSAANTITTVAAGDCKEFISKAVDPTADTHWKAIG